MPIPQPQYYLDDVCTTIHRNTLYTYSSTAFQSLELTQGASWKVLPMGVSVQGSTCVRSTPVNNTDAAAFWVVGGKANSSDYLGLQRYTFAKGEWETVVPTVPVTQNRQWHGAAYLNTSDSILLFAGNQDGVRQASSQTFTIKASSPFDVTAYEASAPPAISPIVIPYTQSKALYVGGSETNTKIMIFSPSNSWEDSNATLATPFYNCSHIQGVIQNGNDASKTLYTFDMTVLPSSVNRTVFIDGEGNPVVNATPIYNTRKRDSVPVELEDRSLERRGNLTVANWPAYNATLAPSTTRSNFAVARDQSGLTVISGGNRDDVLCIFKTRDNCWVNATAKLSSKAAVMDTTGGLGSSPTTILTSDTAAPTSTSAPVTSGPDVTVNFKALGAALGSIIGLTLILLAILFVLRWKRKRKHFHDAGHQRRSSGIPDEKMDFADRGLPQMTSARQLQSHGHQDSAGSMSSMAILLGRVGHKRGSDKGNGSVGSASSSQFNKEYKAAIGKPKLIPNELPFRTMAGPAGDEKPITTNDRPPTSRPRGSSRGGRMGSMRRSSGWNRYWSGGSALNILGFGGKRTTYGDGDSDRSSRSQYSDHRPSQGTQISAIVPPLKISERPQMNRVVSGSPKVHGNTGFPLTQEMTGRIERPGSVSTLSSYDDTRDAFSSGVPASVHEESTYWTPVERQEWSKARAASNAYSESNYGNTAGRETTFPKPPGSRQAPAGQTSQYSSDMSWLNLGDQRSL